MPPTLLILAGPNGAGKTTLAPFLLRELPGITDYVNADDIARGLAGISPDTAAFAAGRLMLARMRQLAAARESFAFETTLATRSYAPWLIERCASGYRVGLLFLSLPSAELAIRRVSGRVAEGGHDVPADTIRRRYTRGLRNLFDLYLPLVHQWRIYDSSRRPLAVIAERWNAGPERVLDTPALTALQKAAHA